MDIGTAKPSMKEREGIVHWGFDLIKPDERFTVKDWKDFAEEKIEDVESRGKVAMVVGGTGLYIDALVYDYKFETKGRAYDKNRGVCIKNLNGKLGTTPHDDFKKYPDRQEVDKKYKIFGVLWSSGELRERLLKRADAMFSQELYKETERLIHQYGVDTAVRKGDVYRFAWKYMQGEITREEAVQLNATYDWHLAKRQITWFKRNKSIEWLPLEKVKGAVIKCIQNEQGK